MTLQINTRSLWIFLIAGIGLIFAGNAGSWIADEDYSPIAYTIGGLIGILVYFTVGTKANLIIPISYGLSGQISLLPLPFSVQQLAMILSCGVFFSEIIFKTSMRKVKTESIDIIAWINVTWLATVFLRNPVGINALGTSLVGGKPYVDFLLSFVSYIILSRQVISPKQANFIVSASVIVNIFVALVCTLVVFIPSLGPVLGPIYSQFSEWGNAEGLDVEVGTSRLSALQGSGMSIITYSICMVNPMMMLAPKNLKFFCYYIVGLLMVFLSGFRSAILSVLLTTALGAILRERMEGLVKYLFCLFFIGALFTVVSYSGLQLPWTFQRSLSFLPGDWDPTAVLAAKESSEWRYEMWHTVLSSDRYIRSKFFGDGYGFLRSEFEEMLAAAKGEGVLTGVQGDQEAHMIQGSYHSGPISSIKRVGYLGLVILLVYMGALARYAWRLIDESTGTPYQLITLYFGIPLIILPFFFFFVFGDYNDILFMMFSLGMMKMISSSIKAYEIQKINTF
jgi:hypothetical protein